MLIFVACVNRIKDDEGVDISAAQDSNLSTGLVLIKVSNWRTSGAGLKALKTLKYEKAAFVHGCCFKCLGRGRTRNNCLEINESAFNHGNANNITCIVVRFHHWALDSDVVAT